MRWCAAVLLLALVAGARAADENDAALRDAISAAVKSALSPSGGVLAAKQTMLSGMASGMNQMASSLSAAYGQASAQAEAALAAFEAQYCTPATFIPSEKVPATFVGHSMAVTFSLGNCTFNESKWLHDDIKELDCGEPSISYVKTPANFTSKYHSAPIFTSKECKVTKTFGEAVQKVLFVFDGTQAPDMNTLVAKITEEVKGVLGSVSSGAQELVQNARNTVGSMFNRAGTAATPTFSYP